MMYSPFAPKHRIAIRAVLSMAWVLSGAGGMAALSFPPQTITNELGTALVIYWGASLSLASLVAAAGVVFNRYRLEWAASWFAFMGMAPYVVAIWGLVPSSVPSRLTQALLASALLLMFASRAILCGAHASKLRAEAQAHER